MVAGNVPRHGESASSRVTLTQTGSRCRRVGIYGSHLVGQLPALLFAHHLLKKRLLNQASSRSGMCWSGMPPSSSSSMREVGNWGSPPRQSECAGCRDRALECLFTATQHVYRPQMPSGCCQLSGPLFDVAPSKRGTSQLSPTPDPRRFRPYFPAKPARSVPGELRGVRELGRILLAPFSLHHRYRTDAASRRSCCSLLPACCPRLTLQASLRDQRRLAHAHLGQFALVAPRAL